MLREMRVDFEISTQSVRVMKKRRRGGAETEQRQSGASTCSVSIHHGDCYVALSCLGAVSLHP